MVNITLASISGAIEAKYGSYDIELEDGFLVSLLNPARLSPADRKALTSLGGEKAGDEDEKVDETEKLTELLRLVAADKEQGARLIKALSPRGYLDLAMLAEVVTGYMEGQKVGEASPSQD